MFKKFLRYALVLVVAFVAIVLVINLPKLGVEMLHTITGISAGDWLKYIVGGIIGSCAMWFATRKNSSSDGE